jgi:phospholipid/cholesterol/gamma-HCH transport system ATP-binding protein
MQKRAAFARAVVIEPPIMLLDEPTAGLDPTTTEHITEQLIAAKKTLGGTTLAITYNLQSAFRIADSIALLHDGRIVAHEEPAAFKVNQHPAIVAFLRDWTEREALRQRGAKRP